MRTNCPPWAISASGSHIHTHLPGRLGLGPTLAIRPLCKGGAGSLTHACASQALLLQAQLLPICGRS